MVVMEYVNGDKLAGAKRTVNEGTVRSEAMLLHDINDNSSLKIDLITVAHTWQPFRTFNRTVHTSLYL
jgi:hypothetical protein